MLSFGYLIIDSPAACGHTSCPSSQILSKVQLLGAYPKTQILEGATLERRTLQNLGFRFSERRVTG